MKIKAKQEKVLRTLLDSKDFVGCGDGIWTTWPFGYEKNRIFEFKNIIFEALNVYFAALKAATKGSPWMGPSFAWTDQDPRGPWTRCSTRPCLPLQTRETVRQANGLRDVDWTFGKFILFRIKIAIRTDACWKSESLFPFSAGLFRQIVLFCYL